MEPQALIGVWCCSLHLKASLLLLGDLHNPSVLSNQPCQAHKHAVPTSSLCTSAAGCIRLPVDCGRTAEPPNAATRLTVCCAVEGLRLLL
jgi:hypothetical protein